MGKIGCADLVDPVREPVGVSFAKAWSETGKQ